MELQQKSLFVVLIALCLALSCTLALPITTSDSQVPDSGDKSVQTSSEKELEDLTNSDKAVDNAVVVPPVHPVSGEAVEEEANVEVKAVKEAPEEVQMEEPVVEDNETEEAVEDGNDVIRQPESKRSLVTSGLPQEEYYYEPQEEQESFMPPELMSNLDLSPSTIAQYLLMTGDFDGFNNALADVFATGLVNEEDVSEYRDAVSVEYEALLQNVVDSQSSYLQELAAPLADSFPTPYDAYDNAPVLPAVQMPLTRQNMGALPELDMRHFELENAMREEERLAPLLSNLISDYYSDEDLSSSMDNSDNADLETLYDLLQKAMAGDSDSFPEEQTMKFPQKIEEAKEEDSTEKELEELSPEQPKEVRPVIPGVTKVHSVMEAKE